MLNLHRTLLRRLFVSWLLISLAIGGGVFLYYIEQIDDRLVELATKESSRLTDAKLSLINNPAGRTDTLQLLANDFARTHFVVVELYDREGRKVVENVNPSFEAIEAYLKQHHHGVPRGDQLRYERFNVGDQPVLQVMVPVKDAAGRVAGYFEGVFAIDAETIARLREGLLVSLLTVLFAVLATTVVLYPVILALYRDVLRQSRDLLKGNIELMEVLGSAVAKRDSDTNAHNYRVTIYAVKLAEAARLDDATIHSLIAGAFLHDVGKIGIPDSILRKPGRLDEGEWITMRGHVALGVDILKKSAWLQQARDVVAYHHEKFDGSGYLQGLKGTAIPVTARIFAIVDIFDALTSKRPYKEPIPFDQAMAIIRGYAGNHLDPELVALFDGIIEPIYREICAAADEAIEARLWAMIERSFFNSGSPAAAG